MQCETLIKAEVIFFIKENFTFLCLISAGGDASICESGKGDNCL